MKTRSPLPFPALRVLSLAASLMFCASAAIAAQAAQPQTIEDIIATQLSYQSPSSINTGTDAAAACAGADMAGAFPFMAATSPDAYPPLDITIDRTLLPPVSFERQSRMLNATVFFTGTDVYAGYPFTTGFQWQLSKDSGKTWQNTGTAAFYSYNGTLMGFDSYNTGTLTTAMNGWQFRATATVSPLEGSADFYNGAPTVALASDPVTITVKPAYIITPSSLALDQSGNLYVADTAANAIWKITDGNKIALFAGGPNHEPGTANGKGTAARFNAPTNIVIRSGTLYVADTGNNTIRAISPDGVVSTIAGLAATLNTTGTTYREGAGATAIFNAPTGIAASDDGQLYVTDVENHLIRKISPAGDTAWLAGTQYDTSGGGGVSGNLTLAGGAITLNINGDYYANSGTLALTAGTLILGAPVDNTLATGTAAIALTTISDLSILNGCTNLGSGYYANIANGSLLFNTGTTALLLGDNATFIPNGTLTPTGTLTLTDTTQAATSPNPNPPANALNAPRFLAAAADTTTTLAQIVANAEPHAPDAYYFGSLRGMTLSPNGDYLYLSSAAYDLCAIKISTGEVIPFDIPIFENYYNPLRPVHSANLRFDNQGNLYIADTDNSRILKITASGSATNLAGGSLRDTYGRIPGYMDGPAADALFANPSDIAIDDAGNIYVADTGNGLIRKIDAANNNVTTLALEEAPPAPESNNTSPPAPVAENSSGDNNNNGGGGAPSLWLLGALGALVALRARKSAGRMET